MLVSQNTQILHLGSTKYPPLLFSQFSHGLTLISFDTIAQIQSLKDPNHHLQSLIDKYLRVGDGEECPCFSKVSVTKDCVFLETVLKQIWAYGNFTGGMLGVGVENLNLCVPLKLSLLGFPKLSDIVVSPSNVMGKDKQEELYVWGEDFARVESCPLLTPNKVKEPENHIRGRISETKFTSYSSSTSAIYAVYNKELFFLGKPYSNSTNIGASTHSTKVIFPKTKISIKGVSCGAHFILVWDEEGKVYGWGSTKNGRLGQLSGFSQNSFIERPYLIEELRDEFIVDAKCGIDHGLALTVSGVVYEWGRQYVTLLKGRHDFNRYQFKSAITKVDVFENHSICLNTRGQIYQWGHHEIESLEQEHYPSIIKQLKNYRIKDVALSENFLVCVREQHSCLKSKSEGVVEKSLKGTNRRTFVDQMVLSNLNLYKLEDNIVKTPSFLEKKQRRLRPNTSKSYIIKTNNSTTSFSKVELAKDWKNKNQKYSETIKNHERKSLIRVSRIEPPTQDELRKSVEKLRLKYSKKSRGFYQPMINEDVLLLQHLVSVLNKQVTCHIFLYVMKKNQAKHHLRNSLKLQKYFHTLCPAGKFESRPNPRADAHFCIKEILQYSLIRNIKGKINQRVQFYRCKVQRVEKQMRVFHAMSKEMKEQLGVLLDYEILSNCRINKTSSNPKIIRFINFIRPQLQAMKTYNFQRKISILNNLPRPQIILKVKEKFGQILPIRMFTRNSADIVSHQQSKFVHQAPAFRLLAEEKGREELIDYLFKTNIRWYINQLIQYQKRKVSFIKSNMEEILLEKARLLLTGKARKLDTLVSFHRYMVSEQVLGIALGMESFPKLPKIELRLSLNGGVVEGDKSVFQKYVQLVSKKISYAKAHKK